MYCQSCGKQIPENSKFCRFCGVRLEEIPPQSAPSSPPPEKLIVPESARSPRRPVPVKEAVEAVKAVSEVVEAMPTGTKPAPPAPASTQKAKPASAARPSAPKAKSAPPVQTTPVVTTSDEWDYADFVVSFAGRNMPSLRINGLAVGKNMSEAEARQLLWKTYQSEINMKLQHWVDLGWQPATPIAPEALELRRFNGYKDKSLLYWILMLVAAIPSVGIALVVALIPSTFVEPSRFVARLRAKRGTPHPD